MFSKREKALIDRLQRTGYKLHREQLDAPFRFLVSPTSTVGTDISKLSTDFQDGVFGLIRATPFTSPISGIVIFPKTLDPKIATLPDHLTFKRKEKSVFVSVNIPFSLWTEASLSRRIDLLANNIAVAIGRIPSKYVNDEDRSRLLNAVDRVRGILKSKLLH